MVALNATLQIAARALCRPGIGLVVACGNRGKAVGILTKSDLVRHLARAGSPSDPVAPLIGRSIVSCRTDDDIVDVWQIMTARRLQNVPVLDDELRPLGVLDIRDVMQVVIEAEQHQEQALVDYISGVGYR